MLKTKWSEWLTLKENEDTIMLLRRNIEKGLPCGNDNFIKKLEKLSGKPLFYKPQEAVLK